MSDMPMCACAEFWDSHHPECPVLLEITRLRAEVERLTQERDQIIERCAEVCEKEAGAPPRWHWEDEARGHYTAAKDCAAAIRAMNE